MQPQLRRSVHNPLSTGTHLLNSVIPRTVSSTIFRKQITHEGRILDLRLKVSELLPISYSTEWRRTERTAAPQKGNNVVQRLYYDIIRSWLQFVEIYTQKLTIVLKIYLRIAWFLVCFPKSSSSSASRTNTHTQSDCRAYYQQANSTQKHICPPSTQAVGNYVNDTD